MSRFAGLLGIIVLLALAFLFSTNRRAIRLKTVFWGLGLQFLFAFAVIYSDRGQQAMRLAGDAVTRVLSYASDGARFVFGDLAVDRSHVGNFFAFQVLPIIIFISALFAVLYYFGVMQVVIRGMAWVMSRFMSVSGAESLDVAASIFMGQTEAPLSIRPLLPECTRSELMTIMTAGMAHVSGAIMGAYIQLGIEARHLLAAVIMTAPGTVLIAKMLVPETEQPKTAGTVRMAEEDMPRDANLLAAITHGTLDGGRLAFNVGIMLISFIALIALLNGLMGGVHHYFARFPDNLGALLGFFFRPVAWLIGIPWKDCGAVGNFLGTRMVVNEFVAYALLAQQKAALDPRSFTIATFALCGFANLSSIGIQIGGIGALAPNRRDDLARLGFRAMLAGTMANLMSASIVGILLKS